MSLSVEPCQVLKEQTLLVGTCKHLTLLVQLNILTLLVELTATVGHRKQRATVTSDVSSLLGLHPLRVGCKTEYLLTTRQSTCV